MALMFIKQKGGGVNSVAAGLHHPESFPIRASV